MIEEGSEVVEIVTAEVEDCRTGTVDYIFAILGVS